MPSIKQVSRHSGLAPALELDTEDYCSKICARRTQTLVKCVAPGCDQLFLHASTISGNASPVFDNHNKYCSTNCHIVDRPDLKNTRTLVRIDDFLNHLFLAIRAVTSDCYLKSEVVVRGPAAHEELRLHVRVKEAKDNSFYNQGSTSGTGRRTMLSHNRCQTAVTNHAGIIAFLIEALNLPIVVREANVDGVQAHQTVILVLPCGRHSQVAPVHTTFRISPGSATNCGWPSFGSLLRDSDLYNDSSAGQYGEEQGLRQVLSYPQDPPASDAFSRPLNNLGTEYKTQVDGIRRRDDNDEYQRIVRTRTSPHTFFTSIARMKELHFTMLQRLRSEPTVRTINTSFHDALVRLGGVTVFSLTNDKDFGEIMLDLISTVQTAVAVNNRKFEVIPASIAEEARYKAIARDSAGQGHWEIVAALERISGLHMQKLEEDL